MSIERTSIPIGDLDPGYIVLYLINTSGGQIVSRTKLQNLIYILQERHGVNLGYKFKVPDLGRSDDGLDMTLTALAADGYMLEERIAEKDSKYLWTHKYVLTEKGKQASKYVEQKLERDSELRTAIQEITRRYRESSKWDVLRDAVRLGSSTLQ